eukprot:TRINITY_DN89144_c0_g1_i1.p3 TRINITY_DN89144_c0_g1~~TRINITY_DN89144_c0_g1_i1.p3  ORF type:complete len:174 (-),score=1.30 TRINITY_DN89144_c0_g1_i1:173-694(-)
MSSSADCTLQCLILLTICCTSSAVNPVFFFTSFNTLCIKQKLTSMYSKSLPKLKQFVVSTQTALCLADLANNWAQTLVQKEVFPEPEQPNTSVNSEEKIPPFKASSKGPQPVEKIATCWYPFKSSQAVEGLQFSCAAFANSESKDQFLVRAVKMPFDQQRTRALGVVRSFPFP